MVNIEDLDQFLAAAEENTRALRPAAGKTVIWGGKPGTKTAISIVYVHGFAASRNEIRPVPDLLAKELGANLFFARLTGHGQDGQALVDSTHKQWLSDTIAAINIGHTLGDKVILMGCSTGCTLLHIALGMGYKAAAAIYIAPNFGLRSPLRALCLQMPWAKYWVPLLFGAERTFDPVNAEQADCWTVPYPTKAVINLKYIINAVRKTDHQAIKVPTLFWFSDHDQTVSPAWMRKIAARMGGSVTIHNPVLTATDDPDQHVVLGDACSPSQTTSGASKMLQWLLSTGNFSTT
ncbi:MAG: alpha/beta hydrolase [Gammaproteobacteria bacterium]|nr:alpha/beta hydrolase [Gammaproteobacteria bacterium]